MHDCGGCYYFIKMKNITGLCDVNDWKVTSDSGKDCEQFKSKKYVRKRESIKWQENIL